MGDDAFSIEDLKAERQFRREARAANTRRAATSRRRATTRASPQPALQSNVGWLYNGMIAPLTGYPIRGVVWYQGEANTNQHGLPHYETFMQGMVGSWRRHWDVGEFPFYFVQIAPFGKYSPADSLPLMWEVQTRAAKSIPNAGMAPTGDIGDAGNIHPTNK